MRREKVPACVHPETYRYFLEREDVVAAWARLAERYGRPRRHAGFRTMEIGAPRFILRSTLLGNPITVLRRRDCTLADIVELHALLGFDG